MRYLSRRPQLFSDLLGVSAGSRLPPSSLVGSALSWLLRSGEVELGLRLSAALSDFWRLGSHVREGVRWLADFLALPEAAGSTHLRARALTAAGELHVWIDAPEAYLR